MYSSPEKFDYPVMNTSVAEPKQFVSAPAPAPTWALWVPVFTAFKWKGGFFMTFRKNIDLIQFFDPIQYELWLNTLLDFDLEPEPGARARARAKTSVYRLRPKVAAPAPAPAPQHWWIHRGVTTLQGLTNRTVNGIHLGVSWIHLRVNWIHLEPIEYTWESIEYTG